MIPSGFAQAGLQRIRRRLQPNFSQVTVGLGSAVETNPRYYLGPRRTEAEGLASAVLFDERAIGGMRWRTTGAVAGNIHSKSHDLDYGNANLDTGPVLDIFPGWSLVPAIGGAASYFDDHFLYGEGAASATFEGPTQGAYRSLQLRTGYRSYDHFFPTSNGFYTEARGVLLFPIHSAKAAFLFCRPGCAIATFPARSFRRLSATCSPTPMSKSPGCSKLIRASPTGSPGRRPVGYPPPLPYGYRSDNWQQAQRYIADARRELAVSAHCVFSNGFSRRLSLHRRSFQ